MQRQRIFVILLIAGNCISDTVLSAMYIGVYAGLGVTNSLGIAIGYLLTSISAIHASRFVNSSDDGLHLDDHRRLQEAMLQAVIRSPMSFFDTTPIGRILNRFAKDIESIDKSIPNSSRAVLSNIINVCYHRIIKI